MFKNLRLKLILINASVIFILFSILVTGTYLYSQQEITHRSDMLAERIMSGIESGIVDDLPAFHPNPQADMIPQKQEVRQTPLNNPPGPSFFFVRISKDGNVTYRSSNAKLHAEDLKKLANSVMRDSSIKGVIDFENSEYRFLKSIKTPAESIILFQDFSKENELLRIQVTALIATGLVCLILSFFGSYFMANRAMIPIQQAWQQQKDFLSDASHELRSPLAVIQTNLDVVLDSPDDTVANNNKWLKNIKEETAQMTKLVNSLLFLARADSNEQCPDKQSLSISDLLIRSTAPFEPVAAAKQISLDVITQPSLCCHGDEIQIKQLISILVDNAIRHTPAGGSVTVQLSKYDNNNVLITVKDTGEGIAQEHLDRIFNRFYQVDASRSNGSSGLGLSIAKWIAESHGGLIKVASTLGKGTIFTVILPCYKETTACTKP